MSNYTPYRKNFNEWTGSVVSFLTEGNDEWVPLSEMLRTYYLDAKHQHPNRCCICQKRLEFVENGEK